MSIKGKTQEGIRAMNASHRTRTIAATALAALATAAAGTAVAGTASAAVASPTVRACHAFTAWDRHRTPANARVMLRDGRSAGYTVRTDIAVVYAEWRQGDWYDLPADVHFTVVDCRHAR